ncbi:DUF7314 family protein [Halalkalicoccus ordinarius]|uniref:DUF7314 family protein n=1 Tax=Halalkalicoccus ordinarius TaxID=3116651 RepID=UPI00300EBD3E
MSDEFMKGFGILTSAGLFWFIVAAWFNTESFGGTQLVAPNPDDVGLYADILIGIKDVAVWFGILGALTFWFVIPAVREGRRAYEERQRSAD